MTDQELKDLVAQTFKGIQELRISQAETSEQMKKTDEKLARMGIHLGNISNNQGDVAEEFFYNSLEDKKDLAGVHYDFIDKNWKNRMGQIADEFDIVMVNGKDIAIIEVKYKAHQSDLEKLLTKKFDNFQLLYPQYKDYTHHLGLASFHINDDLKEQALEAGVIVLQRKGDTLETFIPKAA